MPRSTEADATSADFGRLPRHPGLDCIRGFGAIAVVLLHAGVPYLTTPMPGLIWPIRSAVSDHFVNVVFWGIEACVMPLFLMLSGYVSFCSLRHRGDRLFVRQRVERILYPMLAAACILLPLELYLWMFGWLLQGDLSWKDFYQVRLRHRERDLFGLSHLWYLQYVFLYSLILVGVDRVYRTWKKRGSTLSAISLTHSTRLRRGAVLAIVAGIAAVLWWEPRVVLGFQHSFLPVPSKFAYSGLFFAWGMLEASSTVPAASSGLRRPILWGSFAALLFPAYLALVRGQFNSWPAPFRAALLTATCASLTFGLWLFCQRIRRTPPAVGKYLAAASFWVYLIHHPIVALCHIGLHGTGWPAVVQFAASAAITLLLALASYEVLVRKTAIGSFLNGRNERQATGHQRSSTEELRIAA